MAAAAQGQRQVLLNAHGCGSTVHRILKHAAQKCRTLILRQLCHILAIDQDLSLIYRPYACDGIQHGGFACTVSSDDCDEIPLL